MIAPRGSADATRALLPEDSPEVVQEKARLCSLRRRCCGEAGSDSDPDEEKRASTTTADGATERREGRPLRWRVQHARARNADATLPQEVDKDELNTRRQLTIAALFKDDVAADQTCSAQVDAIDIASLYAPREHDLVNILTHVMRTRAPESDVCEAETFLDVSSPIDYGRIMQPGVCPSLTPRGRIHCVKRGRPLLGLESLVIQGFHCNIRTEGVTDTQLKAMAAETTPVSFMVQLLALSLFFVDFGRSGLTPPLPTSAPATTAIEPHVFTMQIHPHTEIQLVHKECLRGFSSSSRLKDSKGKKWRLTPADFMRNAASRTILQEASLVSTSVASASSTAVRSLRAALANLPETQPQKGDAKEQRRRASYFVGLLAKHIQGKAPRFFGCDCSRSRDFNFGADARTQVKVVFDALQQCRGLPDSVPDATVGLVVQEVSACDAVPVSQSRCTLDLSVTFVTSDSSRAEGVLWKSGGEGKHTLGPFQHEIVGLVSDRSHWPLRGTLYRLEPGRLTTVTVSTNDYLAYLSPSGKSGTAVAIAAHAQTDVAGCKRCKTFRQRMFSQASATSRKPKSRSSNSSTSNAVQNNRSSQQKEIGDEILATTRDVEEEVCSVTADNTNAEGDDDFEALGITF
jgi:hypothetical protein